MTFERALWWGVAWSRLCGSDRAWSDREHACHHARKAWARVHDVVRIGPPMLVQPYTLAKR